MTASTKRRWLMLPAILVLLSIASTVVLGVVSSPSKSKEYRPNIVILLADNLGYNDISLFGAPTAQTPNIDRLGREGLKVNNWNSAAHLCSASRAALLTGKYPARMGIYPRVFRPDAVYGLQPEETTIAEHLKEEGYATSVVGKWHLGHRPDYLPTNQGFDEWIGIPYHMSGGSIDNHTCYSDVHNDMWLPLYQNATIIEQPVRVQDLAMRYANASTSFIERNAANKTPFFLFMSFSHVHQLCAPRDFPEQATCQWSSDTGRANTTFVDAVEEMDWIAGQILQTLDDEGLANDTFVLFTSDNGPWVAEQSCAGSKGPFEGRWLQDNVDQSCTACPHDYVPKPTSEQPRRCELSGTELSLDGVHCGADTGLGSTWEGNLRMPALVRWPGHVNAGTETMRMVSTLDVLPTILSVLGRDVPDEIDGEDISNILVGNESKLGDDDDVDRVLFFWRDGFSDGPLPAPYGRFDVAAVKLGRYKGWIWTKSAHYNEDKEVHHDPPLLFDVLADPAEEFPLDASKHQDLVDRILVFVEEHKKDVGWSYPYCLETDPKFIPCVDESTGCRTSPKENAATVTIS